MTTEEFRAVYAEFYRYTPAAQAAAFRRMNEQQRATTRRFMRLAS